MYTQADELFYSDGIQINYYGAEPRKNTALRDIDYVGPETNEMVAPWKLPVLIRLQHHDDVRGPSRIGKVFKPHRSIDDIDQNADGHPGSSLRTKFPAL